MLRQRGSTVSGLKSDLIIRGRLAEPWAPGGSNEVLQENQQEIIKGPLFSLTRTHLNKRGSIINAKQREAISPLQLTEATMSAF